MAAESTVHSAHLLRQSDDRVIIFQYDHNAASCLDVWQTQIGPRLSMLKKEKQREKKQFPIQMIYLKHISHRWPGSVRSCRRLAREQARSFK